MAGWKRKLRETARRNRVEIVEAGLTRRDLFKLGLLTGSGYLVASNSSFNLFSSGGT